jgi:hypothetical protein
MRDLVALARTRKAKASNGHLRDPRAEAMTRAMNIATDIIQAIRARYPHETDVEHIVRFRRAVESTNDPDVWDAFCGDGEIEVLV